MRWRAVQPGQLWFRRSAGVVVERLHSSRPGRQMSCTTASASALPRMRYVTMTRAPLARREHLCGNLAQPARAADDHGPCYP